MCNKKHHWYFPNMGSVIQSTALLEQKVWFYSKCLIADIHFMNMSKSVGKWKEKK